MLIPVLLFAVCMFSIHTGASEPVANSNELSDANKTQTIPTLIDEILSSDYNSFSITTSTVSVESQINPDDSVYVSVDILPEFPDGLEAFMKYITDNIKYSEKVIQENVEERVYCQFVVEKDGSVSNIVVVRSLRPELDKEAVRVLSTLPKL